MPEPSIATFSHREEEAARFEMMQLIAENPGPCGKRMLFERTLTHASWVDTLAIARQRLAEKQATGANVHIDRGLQTER